MDLDEAITARLNADSATTDHVGAAIHWLERPQTEGFPALVLQVVSQVRDEDLDGEESAPRTARVQLDSLALTKAEAEAGINAAIAALQPEAEVNGEDGGIVFWRSSVEGPVDRGEPTDTGFVHRSSADLIIRYVKT